MRKNLEILSQPLIKTISLGSKIIKTSAEAGRETAKKIKENPRKAIKYGLKIKVCDLMISGLLLTYGLPPTITKYHEPVKNRQKIISYSPIIRDDSYEEILQNLDKIKPKEYIIIFLLLAFQEKILSFVWLQKMF